MSQFIESISCLNGELQLLELHQARVNRTFFTNYGLLARPFKLSKVIRDIPSKGRFKCRVSYDQDNFEITFDQYQVPRIESLQIVECFDIDYRFKYADRLALQDLFAQRMESDDVIIVKNGVVTDSYFANLAFFDGEEWWTPSEPLLEGVKRQRLIDQRLLHVKQITVDELFEFEKCSLINAMLDLGEVEIATSDISR